VRFSIASLGAQSSLLATQQGRTLDFARGDAHFWLTYPLPPDLDLYPDPDPHQYFELDPDPAPDPHQNNADPQPWALNFSLRYLIRNCFVKRTKNMMEEKGCKD
jgi:hypothetical protein